MKNPTLSIELIREILLRLPVRSLLRFRRVCKSWLSLISDPQFAISHYDLAAAPTHRLLLRFDGFYAQSIDMEALLTIDACAVYFPVPPPSPPEFYEDDVQYSNSFRNQHEILGSCRGFILLFFDRSSEVILWNPSIDVRRRLSNPGFCEFWDLTSHHLYGFGHDASTDDYLLVVIGESEKIYIGEPINAFYSFKTDTWDSFDCVSYGYLSDQFRVGTLLNGALHWVVFSHDKDFHIIIGFDLTQRSLSQIPLSVDLNLKRYELNGLRVMGECLSLSCSVPGSWRTEIWVMKEYKVQSSWTKSFVIPTYGFCPIWVSKDVGIFGRDSSTELKVFNNRGELRKYFLGCERQVLYYCPNPQCAIYRESLLSLSNVIQETREKTSGKTREDDRGKTNQDGHGEMSEDNHWDTSEDDHSSRQEESRP